MAENQLFILKKDALRKGLLAIEVSMQVDCHSECLLYHFFFTNFFFYKEKRDKAVKESTKGKG